MGGLKGQRIHEASYTNVNHFEEIHSLSLVPSKSLNFVVDQLKGVARGLEENGHPPCSLIYTDSPQRMCFIQVYFFEAETPSVEQEFHEAITPSLTQDVEHVTLFTDLPPFQHSDDLVTTHFTDDTLLMDSLCDDILEKVNIAEPSQLHIITLAVQSSGMKVNAIQLRTVHYNIVFRVTLLFLLRIQSTLINFSDHRICYMGTLSTIPSHHLDK